jgi:amidase
MPSDEESSVQDWPQTSGFFTEDEFSITELAAHEVVSKIARGNLTALAVTSAICKRAAVAQQLINCTTEILFTDAIARAQELDEYFEREGKTVGPLHGLPISFKDQFQIRGVDTTMGYVARINKPAEEDSTLVTLLVQAGAIPYVKTNVPATLMMGETVNNIFGRTVNPRNRGLTPGGSSGGEAALLAFRGSYLGVGTDIGGSIRTPCSYTGLYGLRPSHGRVSYQRVGNTFWGQEAVRSCAGPMCHSPADIRLFMSSVAAQRSWEHDPQVLPIPWREELESLPEKLCFGFALHDGNVAATPPLRRAMEMTKAALLVAGHHIIEFIPFENVEAKRIINTMWAADGGKEFQRDTDASGEPLPPSVESWLGHSAGKTALSVSETWKLQHERTLLATKWLERWQATKTNTTTGRPIDGLIMPTTPLPAIRHNEGFPVNMISDEPV